VLLVDLQKVNRKKTNSHPQPDSSREGYVRP
jgi:hypothetical protein